MREAGASPRVGEVVQQAAYRPEIFFSRLQLAKRDWREEKCELVGFVIENQLHRRKTSDARPDKTRRKVVETACTVVGWPTIGRRPLISSLELIIPPAHQATRPYRRNAVQN
jgi:hypothetical protein